ncbi:MAG TPA: hypothetical protein PLY40_05710, partial [Bacillota bacterium]|nr:hypothetical protein [Bacillota bacterium]
MLLFWEIGHPAPLSPTLSHQGRRSFTSHGKKEFEPFTLKLLSSGILSSVSAVSSIISPVSGLWQLQVVAEFTFFSGQVV